MRRLKNTRKLIEQEGVRIYGRLHFYLPWSKWLKLTKSFHIYFKRTTKTFHSKTFFYEFIYAIRFKGMALRKLL